MGSLESNEYPARGASVNVPHCLYAARAGSKEALERLLESYRNYLRQVACQRIDRDLRRKIDPSDLAQVTLIEAHRDFHRFTSSTHSRLQAWLATLLQNNLADVRKRYRKSAKRDISRERAFDSRLKKLAHAEQSLDEESPTWERYQRALAKLPPHYQDVVRLRHAERLSFAKIGERLQKTPDAARMLYTRAIKTLKLKYDRGANVER